MSESPAVTHAAATTPWARWFVPTVLVVLVSDQLSKEWIFLLEPGSLPAWMAHHHNTGVAWGIGNHLPVVVTLVTLTLIPLLTWVWWRQFRMLGAWENLAFGAVLGGALGNASDRVQTQFGRLEGVRDFLVADLNLIGIPYIWPTFNIADAGISCGVVVLVVLSLCKRPAAPPPGVRATV
jgi:lipoprotein signal peptidase